MRILFIDSKRFFKQSLTGVAIMLHIKDKDGQVKAGRGNIRFKGFRVSGCLPPVCLQRAPIPGLTDRKNIWKWLKNLGFASIRCAAGWRHLRFRWDRQVAWTGSNSLFGSWRRKCALCASNWVRRIGDRCPKKSVERPDQAWVGDITYIPTGEG